ncbi:hypothetical protein C8R44DRAFT_166885 [Mycena epipterygia]|nr:hypothetical protein C8R44DRAFT_166885 [Mycena epipterygia]
MPELLQIVINLSLISGGLNTTSAPPCTQCYTDAQTRTTNYIRSNAALRSYLYSIAGAQPEVDRPGNRSLQLREQSSQWFLVSDRLEERWAGQQRLSFVPAI